MILNDPYATRVRAAAVAGWWTVLVAVGFTVPLWTAYLVIMANKPARLLSWWGPDITWPEVQRIFLCLAVAFRFFLWLLVLAVLWLTLWGRQLSRRAGAA